MKNFLSNPIQRRYIAHLVYTFAFRKAQGRLTSTSFSLIEITGSAARLPSLKRD